MTADFTPTFEPYTGQGSFIFWAQKVLPLVYDDSLSYYETLLKVTAFLNNLIKDVDTVEGNLDALRDTYEELQDYVNNYFANVDVQQEINRKLDVMVRNGTFTRLLEPFVTPDLVAGAVSEQIDNVVADQIDDAVATPAAEAAGAWLDAHVTPLGEGAVVIDDTLTISGAAADSKVVGDRMADERQHLDAITTAEGYIQYNDGVERASSGSGNYYRYSRKDNVFTLSGACDRNYSFYNISGNAIHSSASAGTSHSWDKTVPLVAGHEYESTFTLMSGSAVPADDSCSISVQIIDTNGNLEISTAMTSPNEFKWYLGNACINVYVVGSWTFTDAVFGFTIKDITRLDIYDLNNAWRTKIDSCVKAINMNVVESSLDST